VILVDTSVWVEHLRSGNAELRELLEDGEVMCHLFVIGELACGSMRNRSQILELLKSLPSAPLAEHTEALHFLNKHRLFGHGLGWIDIHLLAAASLAGTRLWTRDRALKTATEHLGISY
jgi:predicted nucleic acid-binding protein